ncbi:MAG TPA: nicotinate-nucleotide--dimethylbenzimidazole phosphoribosyltransferase [Candidatus Limnocylindrales bacterium]|nr:nicotinate-nucleotide--dimethylbenzimidazole phosphoribosyltransferase [Candidatus Limnocylindrales bacterium]
MTDDSRALDLAIARVVALRDLDEGAMAATSARLDALTKPPGSLGRLESLAIQLAGITGDPAGTFERRAVVVAAADHGVVRQGVSAYPADVTPQMVANFLAGGAAINVLAERAGASVTVVDAGVAGDISAVATAAVGSAATTLIRAPIRAGTDDMTAGPAMTRDEALRAIRVGLELAAALESDGIKLVGIGEMGIGNTTAASAITSVMTGLPPERVTGRGTGIDDATHARKIEMVTRAIARNVPEPGDPIGVLAAVGGFEIGVLVGVIIGAAGARIPVILDGFITGAAALIAAGLAPAIEARCVAGHRSVEPGHAVVLERLRLRPLLELDLRLGEGTGAALAMSLIDAAIAIRDGMATFESAGVAGPAATEGVV